MRKLLYFCIVFFMVLDLRLMEIGLPGGNPSFFCSRQSAVGNQKKIYKNLQISIIFRNFAGESDIVGRRIGYLYDLH